MGEEKKVTGLFVAFEGIDGSGKSTQIVEVLRAIQEINKYQPIVRTREPTWRAEEIRRRLEIERDPMSNSSLLAAQFISDRREHYLLDIRPDLERNYVVLCDRYAMSTLAYQSLPGKTTMFDLVSAHFTANIGTPDVTFYLNLSADESMRRIASRSDEREKFEDIDFAHKLVERHEFLYQESQKDGIIGNLLGKIIKIDATHETKIVTSEILRHLEPIYLSKIQPNNI